MLQHSLQLVQDLIAQAPADDGKADDGTMIINTTGILAGLAKFVVPVLLGALGIWIISRAHRGRVGEATTAGFITIIGICFLAGAPVFFLVGGKLVSTIFGS